MERINKLKMTAEKEKKRLLLQQQQQQQQDKYTFTPEDIKYENKHYKYIKYTKYNKVGVGREGEVRGRACD